MFYYEGRGAQGFVIVCDQSRPETLGTVEKWIEQIYYNTDIKSPSILVLANKRDLPASQKKMSASLMEDFQREKQGPDLSFFEVSARADYQVEAAFMDLGQRMFEKGQ